MTMDTMVTTNNKRRFRFFVLGILFLFLLVVPAYAATTPNDPLFREQWYLQQIKAPEAWEVTSGSRDVVVAVIDSGVDTNHEDLVGALWTNRKEIPANGIDDDRNGYVDDAYGWDFVLNNPDPNPKFQGKEEHEKRPAGVHHGTLVAGLIAAQGNNGKGIMGVAEGVRIMPLRAIPSSGRGEVKSIVSAIDYAVTEGAQIINLSFETDVRSTILIAALRRAYAKGVVVVAAAGNDSIGAGVDLDVRPLYPVCAYGDNGSDYVIGVAGTDRQDVKASVSHFGSRCIDISAPSVDILTTSVLSPAFGFDSPYSGEWSGTSFGTALVSGAAALLKSIDPDLSPSAIKSFLQEGADSLSTIDRVYGARMGAGRLNIAQSIARLRSSTNRDAVLKRWDTGKKRTPLLAVTYMNGKESTRLVLKTLNGEKVREWFPFFSAYRGAVHLIARDIDGDDRDKIIVSAGRGGGPHVRMFNLDGDLTGQFFAYEKDFRGGVSVDIGDPNPMGAKEIVAISGRGRQGEAKVLSSAGEKQLTFFPFTDAWMYGSTVRIGDVNGDGIDDIVFATEESATPTIRATNIFGAELFTFQPYTLDVGPMGFTLADVDGDGMLEIITSRGRGDPEIRVWKKDRFVASFLAYAPSFRGGVSISSGDIDSDGRDEIIATPRANGGPHIKIFSGEGVLKKQFFGREKSWRGGIETAFIRGE